MATRTEGLAETELQAKKLIGVVAVNKLAQAGINLRSDEQLTAMEQAVMRAEIKMLVVADALQNLLAISDTLAWTSPYQEAAAVLKQLDDKA